MHDWLYKYEKYPARVHAFYGGPTFPDWIDRKCYGCDTLEKNKDYQKWLDYITLVGKQMELERKKYGHALLRNVFP